MKELFDFLKTVWKSNIDFPRFKILLFLILIVGLVTDLTFKIHVSSKYLEFSWGGEKELLIILFLIILFIFLVIMDFIDMNRRRNIFQHDNQIIEGSSDEIRTDIYETTMFD